jgi:hypothetical protein
MGNSILNTVLVNSVYASLFVQIGTGLVDLYVYFLPVARELAIVKKMLALEIFVQIVEGSFYTWLASTSVHVKNITPHRYYDWAITTPTMLFTFCLYLDYLGERRTSERSAEDDYYPDMSYHRKIIGEHEKNTKEQLTPLDPEWQNRASDNTNESPRNTAIPIKDITLSEYLWQKKGLLLPIFVLNWIMLMFGYLGEIGELDNKLAVICGFLPFITFFVIIYDKFAKHSTMTGQIIYWLFFIVWALYGVAALATYYWKNIAYNILDLFAKNFFGMLLAYTLYTHS